ncbi:TPA: phage head closure protein [Pseudomonas aeruginosa]
MRAGRLRHPLTIEREERVPDGGGGFITKWVAVGREWASLEGINGREFIAANAQRSETTWRVTLRYRADLVAKWRLRDGNTVFSIEAVLPDNGRRQLVLMCKSGVLK